MNRSMSRDRCEILRHELQHISQDGEIHVERLQCLPGFLDPQGGQGVNRDPKLPGALPQRIGCFARLLRGAKDPGNDVAALHKGVHRRLAEVPLPHDGYAHHPSLDISYIMISWRTIRAKDAVIGLLLTLRILGIGSYIDGSLVLDSSMIEA